MIRFTLTLLCFLFTFNLFSQIIKDQIDSKINQGIQVSDLNILEKKDLEIAVQSRYVSKAEYYEILPDALTFIQKENSELLRINFGNDIIMLQAVNIFADNYRLITSDGLEKSAPDIKFYHGYINGNANSHVAFSFSKNGLKAYITDDNGTYEINKLNENTYEGHFIADAVDKFDFTCDTNAANFRSEDHNNSRAHTDSYQKKSSDCVEIFFEADFATYQDFGSSVTNLENWLADIFNEVSILYANESIPIAISETFVWTSSSNPLDTTSNTFQALRAFAHSRQNNYNGRLAHYISTRPLGGGVAQVDALCDTYSPSGSGPYGVSASLKIPVVPFPTYSWNVLVIAHELGHNFGSRHSHDCVWDIDNDGIAMERIDDCSRGSCYDSLNVVIPPNGGTIMSYCHLNSVGINFNNGFGPLPGALIYDKYLTASCVTGGCNGVCNIVGLNAVLLDCDNNGTAVDFSDDIFQIEINPVGFNLTGAYTVSGSTSAVGNYGTPLILDNNGNGFTPGTTVSIIVTDSNDSNCSDSAQVDIPSGCVSFNNCQDAHMVGLPYSGVDPGPNSGDGALNFPAAHSNWYKFVANCNSTVTVSSCLGGADTRLWVYEGNCTNLILHAQADDECKDESQSFFKNASETSFLVYNGNTYYIEWDNRWSEDEFNFTIEYNHTSCGPCEILDAGIVITDCDNNGTPNNSTDDTYDISISPTAIDFGNTYSITGDLSATGTYGNTVEFSGLTAGSTDLNLSITDSNDPNCTLNMTINNPGSCSFDAPLVVPNCNDFENGQLLPNWTGDIDGIGNSTWASWSVISGPSDPFDNTGPVSGNNSEYYLFFDATSAQVSDTFMLYSPVYDISNISSPQCSFATYMQGSCVGTLLVDIEEPAGSGNYTNIFTESGNIGEFWLPQIIQLCDVTETLISFRFSVIHCDGSSGVPVRGDIAIDDFCVEKGPDCSECAISNPGFIPSFCEDNGTPSNPTDDYAIVSLDPTGNLLGSGYTVSGDISASGVYGLSKSVQIPTGFGDLNLTITDNDDANCINNFNIIDIGSCSDTPPNPTPSCESFEQSPLPSVWYGDVVLNSDGAPGKWNIRNRPTATFNTGPPGGYNSEKYIFFESGSFGNPLSAGEFAVLYTPIYNVNGLSNPMLSFASYISGDCVGNLTVELESPIHSGIYTTIYSQSGEIGDFWEIQSIPLCNLADTLVAFKITGTTCDGSIGPTYQGDIAIDELCVIDGVDCSSCAIAGAALMVSDCDVNNTPMDNSDDIFSMSIIPSGYLLGNSYTISGDVNVNANYGGPLNIDNLPAGSGDLNITITDDSDSNCSLQISIQDPGSCSNFTPTLAPVCIDFEDGYLPQSWLGDLADLGLATHWSVDSGGTGTPTTGPSSGNNGSSEYLYFESSGTAALESAYVYSTLFDISSLTNPYLNFSSHLYGECIGTLSIEIESPAGSGNFTNVFSLSGEQGDFWQDHEVALCSFTDPLIAIKIIAIACDGNAGPVFRGDIAIDDLCLQEGPPCPCQDIIVQNSNEIIDGLYEADDYIKSAATVQANGSVILKASNSVELLSDFYCPPNTALHVYIEGCTNN